MSAKLCTTCGKAPLANRAGSVTAYFFQHNYCQCHNARPIDRSKSEVCSNCGKARPLSPRVGSFTSFLFKELRCQCAGSPVKKNRSGGSSQHTATAQRLTQRRQFTQLRLSNSNNDEAGDLHQVLPANSVIGGSFRVIEAIGMGGMGVVYLVEQMSLRKRLALKVLAPELVNEQSWLRFQAEAKTLASLNHATMVKVYDLGIHERSLPFYSMDYLNGRNLEEVLIDDGPLSVDQALPIFIEVLAGLAYAHRNGIIHRDLKPSNIMLCTIDGVDSVKILDFGISKLSANACDSAQSLTSTGEVFGSPYYMSPEQCLGEVVDARSDIYSIGCALFEVLTGYVPFEGRSSVETVTMHQDKLAPRLSDVSADHDFPSSIELVLAKCLAKLPQDRYQSAKELSLDLERIVEGKDVLTYTRSFPLAEVDVAPDSKGSLLRPAVIGVGLLLTGLAVAYGVPQSDFFNKSNSASTAVSLSAQQMETLPVPATQATQAAEQKSNGTSGVASGYDSFVAIVGDADYSMGAYVGAQPEPKTSQFETGKYSTTSIVNGQRMIKFKFPTDVVIGKLYIGHDDPGIDARGDFVCSRDAFLTYMPSQLVARYPQYVKRFRPDDLNGVIIFANAGDDSVLKAITNLPNLRLLSVMANTQLTSASIPSFNKFKNLEMLDASSSYLTGGFFASANCWSKLKQLHWSSPKEPTLFLKKLEASPELQFLRLSGATLSHEDVISIGKFANLQQLDLSQTKLSRDDLTVLSSLKKLTQLNIKDCQVGLAAIPALKQFKALKDLEILSSGTPHSTAASLLTALPGVRVH